MPRALSTSFTRAPETEFYLTSAQAAEALGITKRTLKNWLRTGKIPEPERNPANGYRRWRLRDIEEVRQILKEAL